MTLLDRHYYNLPFRWRSCASEFHTAPSSPTFLLSPGIYTTPRHAGSISTSMSLTTLHSHPTLVVTTIMSPNKAFLNLVGYNNNCLLFLRNLQGDWAVLLIRDRSGSLVHLQSTAHHPGMAIWGGPQLEWHGSPSCGLWSSRKLTWAHLRMEVDVWERSKQSPYGLSLFIFTMSFFGGGQGLNSGLYTYKASALPLESYFQSIFLWLFWRWSLQTICLD
jgi:hypothetical protein